MTLARWVPTLGLLALACGGSEPEPYQDTAAPAVVNAHRVERGEGNLRYDAAGSVRAIRRAELATRLAGTIETVRVRAGDRVRAGQELVSLERAAPEAGLAQARASLDLAARTLARMERLHADSVVPLAQLEAARAAYAQAQAQARGAEAEVGYAGLRAPFAGIVTARLVDPGDLASPGRPLLIIEGSGAKEIVVGVPDHLATAIRIGMTVPVRVGSGERRVAARVKTVIPVADPASRTSEVRLTAPDDLSSGAVAIAEFSVGTAGRLLIPTEALYRRNQLVGVYLFAPDSTVRLRWIRIGRIEGDRAEVLAGLEAGDLIALRPDSLVDGMPARPRIPAGAP